MTQQGGLFEADLDAHAPLAFRMRPRSLDEIVGQEQILGPGKPLRAWIARDAIPPMILWGPPGTGKTTLALAIARASGRRMVAFSAVTGGVPELRKQIDSAREALRFGERTILFVDEIHRFNKAQQDALLPHVEDGTVTLVGATTENPSFEVNPALRSRARILVLVPLEPRHIREILDRAMSDSVRGLGLAPETLAEPILELLIAKSGGDARVALSNLEAAVAAGVATVEQAREILGKGGQPYDKDGESHHDRISAFIKSIRGSDPDAALYWLATMLEGGEDPVFLARRLVIAASEDVGNAAPMALVLATAAFDAVRQVGMPEARIPLAHATTYLATAPKSNAAYMAIARAMEDVLETGPEPVPLHLRNAPTGFLKSLGHGQDYVYPHDRPEGFDASQRYFPDALPPRAYYQPTDRGSEAAIRQRLGEWRAARSQPPE